MQWWTLTLWPHFEWTKDLYIHPTPRVLSISCSLWDHKTLLIISAGVWHNTSFSVHRGTVGNQSDCHNNKTSFLYELWVSPHNKRHETLFSPSVFFFFLKSWDVPCMYYLEVTRLYLELKHSMVSVLHKKDRQIQIYIMVHSQEKKVQKLSLGMYLFKR